MPIRQFSESFIDISALIALKINIFRNYYDQISETVHIVHSGRVRNILRIYKSSMYLKTPLHRNSLYTNLHRWSILFVARLLLNIDCVYPFHAIIAVE
jgi:hypothetical protein